MIAAVTGAGGFCGRHLVRHLAETGVEVHRLSAKPDGGSANERIHTVDPTDATVLAAALGTIRPDWVFHLAGLAAGSDVAAYYRINVLYAANLLQAAEIAGLSDRPMLWVGTAAEYGPLDATQLPVMESAPTRPVGHYGISKLAQTHMGLAAARSGRPVMIARPSNIIGPGMPEHIAIQSFARQVAAITAGRQPPIIETGNLDGIRDFIDVADVARLYVRLMQTPRARGEIVHVCTGEGTSLRDILERMIKRSGLTIEVRLDPARLRALDVPVYIGSTAKLRGLLGEVRFTPLDETLDRISQQGGAP
ncbi:MAG: NAD-dependent epimerase/dehydratase family protein [Dongiaceae bacterium]